MISFNLIYFGVLARRQMLDNEGKYFFLLPTLTLAAPAFGAGLILFSFSLSFALSLVLLVMAGLGMMLQMA